MPSIIIKDNSGIDFPDEKISLQGGGIVNTISDEQLKALKSNEKYKFSKLVEKGLIIIGNKNNVSDDIKQETLDKQNKNIKANQSANNVKLEKE